MAASRNQLSAEMAGDGLSALRVLLPGTLPAADRRGPFDRAPFRLALVVAVVVAYAFLSFSLAPSLGPSVGVLAVLPVTVGGLMFGVRGGALAGLAAIPANSVLVNLAGAAESGVIIAVSDLPAAAALVVALVLVWDWPAGHRREDVNGPPTSHAGDRSSTEASLTPSDEIAEDAGEAAEDGVAVGEAALADLDDIRAAALNMSTGADLERKGFPVISPARGAELEQTSAQSIEEVIADLGNLMAIGLNSTYSGHTMLWPQDLRSFRGISSFMKVLRVIEEGRADPQRVSALLRNELEITIKLNFEAELASNNEDFHKERGTVPQDVFSDYYKAHRRYEDGERESGRVRYAGYCILYALANIDQLGPADLIARWVDRRRLSIELPWDMDIWLIDQYFKRPDVAGTAAAARHAELTAGFNLDGGRIRQSRWSAAWDVHGMLISARNVDVSDIPTIEVLAIPRERPGFEDMERCRITDNFLEHAGYLEGPLGQMLVQEQAQAKQDAAGTDQTKGAEAGGQAE